MIDLEFMMSLMSKTTIIPHIIIMVMRNITMIVMLIIHILRQTILNT